MTATVQAAPKTFEVNQICEMGWGCPTRYEFFIVTRISKSNVWLKPIPSIRINDEWGRQWGFQKWNSLPNFKKVDGKNVPISQGKEFQVQPSWLSIDQTIFPKSFSLEERKILYNLYTF